MNTERFVIAGVTGDRSDLADYFMLRVTPYLLENTENLMKESVELQKRLGGSIDVTKRGDVEFELFYDPSQDDEYAWLFERLETTDFTNACLILPLDFDARKYIDLCKQRRSECPGIQVWAMGHVRLTCYPKEASYRIETRASIHSVLAKLRKDFNYAPKYR